MDKKELEALLARIEAGVTGDWSFDHFSASADCDAHDAFHGSLDAAMALMKAVLLGTSQYSIGTDPTVGKASVCWWPNGLSQVQQFYGECWFDDNPARALLIAILKALIASLDMGEA